MQQRRYFFVLWILLASWQSYPAADAQVTFTRIGPHQGVAAQSLLPPPTFCNFGAPVAINASNGFYNFHEVAANRLGQVLVVYQNLIAQSIEAIEYNPQTSSWGAPVTISSSGATASLAKVALSTSGNGMAVWKENNGSSNFVKAARFIGATHSWQSPVTLDNGDMTAAPSIAINSNDQATVVFTKVAASPNDLFAAHYLAGSWQAPVLIENDNSTQVLVPTVKMDNAGNAVVVFVRSTGFSAGVRLLIYRPGIGWTPTETNVYAAGGIYTIATNDPPTLAMNQIGDLLVAFGRVDTVSTNFDVLARRFNFISGGNSAATIVNDFLNGALNPKVGLDAVGNGTILYTSGGASPFDLFADGYVNGGPYGTDLLLENSNLTISNLNMVLSDNGHAVTTFLQGTIPNVSLYANQQIPGMPFASQSTLIESFGEELRAPRLALSGDNKAVVVFRRVVSGMQQLMAIQCQ